MVFVVSAAPSPLQDMSCRPEDGILRLENVICDVEVDICVVVLVFIMFFGGGLGLQTYRIDLLAVNFGVWDEQKRNFHKIAGILMKHKSCLAPEGGP